MSNSPLVQATILSPNHSGRRNQKITKIAIHVETIALIQKI